MRTNWNAPKEPENDAALRRALRLLPHPVVSLQHPSRVFALAISPDGRSFATGDRDGTTRIFRLPDAQRLGIAQQAQQVFALAFSPDGRHIVSGSGDQTVRLIDAQTAQVRWTTRHSGRVLAVAISPRGDRVAIGTETHDVVVRELETGRECWHARTEGHVSTLAFSPDSRLLAVAGGGTLHIFASADGRVRLSGGEPARELTFSPDGRLLAVSRDATGVTLLAAPSWTPVASFGAGAPIAELAFDSTATRLATASLDGNVRIWDVAHRRETKAFNLGAAVMLFWLQFSPDGHILWVGSSDKTARGIDVVTGTERWRIAHNGFLLAGAITPDGRYVITGGDDGVARVSEPSADDGTIAVPEHGDLSVPLVVTDNGRCIVAATPDRHLHIVDASSRRIQRRVVLERPVTALQPLPDRAVVVMALEGEGIRALDLASGEMIWDFPVRARVDRLAVLPKGDAIAFATWSGELALIEASSGRSRWTLTGGRSPILGLAVSADGRRVATIGVVLACGSSTCNPAVPSGKRTSMDPSPCR
jgi:WD40 repeat protein